MGDSIYRPGRTSGSQFESQNDSTEGKSAVNERNRRGKDDDLIIEENTVYEIDRECYERLKKQKKR